MRLRLTVLTLLVGGLVLVPAAAAGVDLDRATNAYAAMQQAYFDPVSGQYREEVGGPVGTPAWPLSQAVAATLSLRQVAAASQRLALLDRGYRAGAVYVAGPGGPVFWDDNEWIGLDLLDWNAIEPSADVVRKAMLVFGAVARAWDAQTSDTCSGGVRWTTAQDNLDRGTVSTATGALLGLRLYQLTHRPVLLYWSQRMLGWLDACMLAPNGLFSDHLAGDGSLDATQWSYNQGSALGAYLMLYETTGSRAALARAEAIADGTLAAFATRWSAEPPEFAAIFFRRLLELAQVDGRSGYVAAAQAYGDAEWVAARDPATGLFSSGPTPRLLDQAAMVQLYAALSQSGR